MKVTINTPVLVVIGIVVVGVLGFYAFTTVANAGNLDNGTVKYTPGKPPWLETDPAKKGPGGSPAGGGPGTPPQSATPVAPPGMGAPIVGNTPK